MFVGCCTFEIATICVRIGQDFSARHEFFVRGKEACHVAAVRVFSLPGWGLLDPAAAGALGRTDLSHVSRGADGELSETHAPVSVRFNALRAAWSSLAGPPKLRLADCTRWPERADCGQECIPDAVRAQPAPVVDHVPWRTRRIVHLPVLLAGAAAWVLGMAWHSQYLFRPRWAMALGLSDPQTLTLARMLAPHLLSVGACVLFAYGVAGLLRWLGSRTLTHGLEVAAALWLATFAAIFAGPDGGDLDAGGARAVVD